MAEAGIRRKTQLLLQTISPVYNTYDELVKKKLKRGKFPQTKTGIIKMVGMSLEFSSLASWIVITPQCNNWTIAYVFLVSDSIGFLGQLILFLLFSLGLTIKNPGRWISADVGFNFFVSLLTIIDAILTLKMCVNNKSLIYRLAEILGICGAGVELLSCVAILLMYRYVEDDVEGSTQTPPRSLANQRKSIFA
ncbi:uncharacterized protein LOC115888024 [Sitophilus oryzae]|uniref:Uncharacterized protein LOC115888024 n=1 Tax=Sitophilus oryzae TaxID=7048 RepID=A0A6J2YHF8_SITOR|nr:uncharacterized protein LOC115888024 [Sitophilus oryzae]